MTFPVAAALERDATAYRTAAERWMTEPLDPAAFASVPLAMRERLGVA